jgi:hypothetical protein
MVGWGIHKFTKREFDKQKKSNPGTFSAGDIVYVIRPHSGHLAQKFQPQYEEPFSIINQTKKSHNHYVLQDCIKTNQTRSVLVNLIKHGTFREQLYNETVYAPLTDSELPQQPAVLLRTLINLNAICVRKAHGQLYETRLLLLLIRLLQLETDRFKDRGGP